MCKHPAAFINVIAEEGSKFEAIYHLQKTWDELIELEKQLIKQHGFTYEQLGRMKSGLSSNST